MTDPHEQAMAVLADCREADECTALLGYLRDDLPRDALDYEDLFFPLRHHAHDGVALEVLHYGELIERLRWGSGDLVFPVDEDGELLRNSVDPIWYWQHFSDGRFDVRPTIVEELERGADDE